MKRIFLFITLLLTLAGYTTSVAQDLHVCQGDSLRLSTLSLPGVGHVEWYRNGQFISSDTAFVITQPGVYTLMCESTSGCHSGFSQPLTVTIDSLTAVNDSVSTAPGTAVTIRILGNDLSPCFPIDTPTLVVTHQGGHGTATYNGNGTFIYTPEPGFVGIDTFYYVVNDVNGNPSNTAMVLVTIGSPTPLPMTLGEFVVTKVGTEAHLVWNTFRTNDASHFEIERSSNGKDFSFKGKVMAPANSNEETEYNYWDKNPLAGRNYYRLKMVDRSGGAVYSETRMVIFGGDGDIKLYPNPATDYITIDVGEQLSNVQDVLVVDAVGRELIRKTVTTSSVTLDIRTLAQGVYYIRLADSNNTIIGTYKFTRVVP